MLVFGREDKSEGMCWVGGALVVLSAVAKLQVS